MSDSDRRRIWCRHFLSGNKSADLSGRWYGWGCERTPAEREKEREFYGIYFNEYHAQKNGQSSELGELPDYLEEKPSLTGKHKNIGKYYEKQLYTRRRKRW